MEYQFKSIGKRCAATGVELKPGALCYSALIEDDGELRRLDYSEEGWKGPPPKTVGTWRTRVPLPVAPRRDPLDAPALLAYFDQLTDAAQPAHDKLRYILALLLLQKRRFRLDGSRADENGEFLQFSGVQGEGSFEVPNYQLSDEEIQELQRELNAHLAAEWGESAVPSAPASPVSA